ncbi:MAG: hypothetical protein LBJ76_05285, partial [Candidatus Accumulibacter sp.]|nr:hypothetical protein [Accumulibacter sp.]
PASIFTDIVGWPCDNGQSTVFFIENQLQLRLPLSRGCRGAAVVRFFFKNARAGFGLGVSGALFVSQGKKAM